MVQLETVIYCQMIQWGMELYFLRTEEFRAPVPGFYFKTNAGCSTVSLTPGGIKKASLIFSFDGQVI